MSVLNSGDFRGGSFPRGKVKGARDFQQSFARDRDGGGFVPGLLDSFGFDSGWEATLLGGDWQFADYELQLIGVETLPDGSDSSNPFCSLQPVSTNENDNSASTPIVTLQQLTPARVYAFRSGASATLIYQQVMAPGQWEFTIVGNGNKNTSGDAELTVNGQVVFGVSAGEDTSGHTVTMIMQGSFSVGLNLNGMNANWIDAVWEVVNQKHSDVPPFPVINTVLESGNGVPPIGKNCGAGPGWNTAFLPIGTSGEDNFFAMSNVPNPRPQFNVGVSGRRLI